MLTPMQRRLQAVRNWPMPILFILGWFPLICLLFSGGLFNFLLRLHGVFLMIGQGRIFDQFDIRMTGALDQSTLQKLCFSLLLFSFFFLIYSGVVSRLLGENSSRYKWVLVAPYILLGYIAFLMDLNIIAYLLQYVLSMGLTLNRILGLVYGFGIGYLWYICVKLYVCRLYGFTLSLGRFSLRKRILLTTIGLFLIVLAYFFNIV